jgi:hypothetical protein
MLDSITRRDFSESPLMRHFQRGQRGRQSSLRASRGQASLDELVEHRSGDRRANFFRQSGRRPPHTAGVTKFRQLDRRPLGLAHRADAVNLGLHTVDVEFDGGERE